MDWRSIFYELLEDIILPLNLFTTPEVSQTSFVVLFSALDFCTASLRMSRVHLNKIRSLTLYRGELTKARRVDPVPQLKCIGKACELFQPEVVRCTNSGGTGVDIDWTCEADLPEKLRFGKIEVSCEGWSEAGDPVVLKGSCGLEYHLVNIDDKSKGSYRSTSSESNSALDNFFIVLTLAILAFIIFKIWSGNRNGDRDGPGGPGGRAGGGGGGGGGGWFSPRDRPPPPYSPHAPPPKPSSSRSRPDAASSSSQWYSPTYLNAAGLGALGGFLAGRYAAPRSGGPSTRTQVEMDREREHSRARGRDREWLRNRGNRASEANLDDDGWEQVTPETTSGAGRGSRGWFGSTSGQGSGSGSGGGGSSSNLGSIRSSTGYGVTKTR